MVATGMGEGTKCVCVFFFSGAEKSRSDDISTRQHESYLLYGQNAARKNDRRTMSNSRSARTRTHTRTHNSKQRFSGGQHVHYNERRAHCTRVRTHANEEFVETVASDGGPGNE